MTWKMLHKITSSDFIGDSALRWQENVVTLLLMDKVIATTAVTE